MLRTPDVNRPTRASASRVTSPVPPQCALCGEHRASGDWLASGSARMLWACVDCQHKLARRVDDAGVLGG